MNIAHKGNCVNVFHALGDGSHETYGEIVERDGPDRIRIREMSRRAWSDKTHRVEVEDMDRTMWYERDKDDSRGQPDGREWWTSEQHDHVMITLKDPDLSPWANMVV